MAAFGEPLRPTAALVTGGAGFIGSSFVRGWLTSDPRLRIVTLDKLTYAGSLDNLAQLAAPERHTFVRGDICDRALVERLMREHAIDAIVHFAAESHVDRSIDGPAAFVEANIVGTAALLDAARACWLAGGASLASCRFHHVSTDEVYGSLGPADAAFDERSRYDPRSPYAASKASADHLVRAYAHTYGLPVTISNCSNNYGPRQHAEKLIPMVVAAALAQRPIPVYGDGSNMRDWLHVEDHCRAIDAVIRRGRPGQTYHVAGGNERANLELVRLVCAEVDALRPAHAPHARLITRVADRPGHDWRYAMDVSKIRAELGWAPQIPFEEGIHQTVRWYVARA